MANKTSDWWHEPGESWLISPEGKEYSMDGMMGHNTIAIRLGFRNDKIARTLGYVRGLRADAWRKSLGVELLDYKVSGEAAINFLDNNFVEDYKLYCTISSGQVENRVANVESQRLGEIKAAIRSHCTQPLPAKGSAAYKKLKKDAESSYTYAPEEFNLAPADYKLREASKKNTPLQTPPEFEEGSNGWALDPDHRKDNKGDLPLEELNPDLFKEAGIEEEVPQSSENLIQDFGDKWYFGTSDIHRDEVRANGLQPYTPIVNLMNAATDMALAVCYPAEDEDLADIAEAEGGTPVVFEIDLTKCPNMEWFSDVYGGDQGWYSKEVLPPAAIKRMNVIPKFAGMSLEERYEAGYPPPMFDDDEGTITTQDLIENPDEFGEHWFYGTSDKYLGLIRSEGLPAGMNSITDSYMDAEDLAIKHSQRNGGDPIVFEVSLKDTGVGEWTMDPDQALQRAIFTMEAIPGSAFKKLKVVTKNAGSKTAKEKEVQGEETFRGLPVHIEFYKGDKRHNRTLQADYGFIPDTTGRGDGEAVDVYLGENEQAPQAYVVEQLKEDGSFDEFKVMLGFDSLQEAEAVYCAQFDPGWRETRVKSIYEVPVEEFLDTAEEKREEPKTAGAYGEWYDDAPMKQPPLHRIWVYHPGLETHDSGVRDHSELLRDIGWKANGLTYDKVTRGSAVIYPDEKVVLIFKHSYYGWDKEPCNLPNDVYKHFQARYPGFQIFTQDDYKNLRDVPMEVLQKSAAVDPWGAQYEDSIWVYHPDRGVKTSKQTKDHDDLLRDVGWQTARNGWGAGITYDQIFRGYASAKPEEQAVRLYRASATSPEIPEDVWKEYKSLYPGYKVLTQDTGFDPKLGWFGKSKKVKLTPEEDREYHRLYLKRQSELSTEPEIPIMHPMKGDQYTPRDEGVNRRKVQPLVWQDMQQLFPRLREFEGPTQEVDQIYWDNAYTHGLPHHASTYQNTPAKVEVGDGFYATYTPHKYERGATGDANTWHFFNPEGDKIGEVCLYFYSEDYIKYPSIGTITLWPEYQNKGLGRKFVKAIAGFYGGLTSDPQGNTNSSAVKMWQAIGGEKVPTDKNTKGYMYQITAALPDIRTERLTKALNSVRDRIVGQPLADLDVADILNEVVNRFNIEFKPSFHSDTSGNANLAKSYIRDAGIDPETGNIDINYESGIGEYLEKVDEYEWKEFVQSIASVAAHEMTHGAQIESVRNDKPDEYEAWQVLKDMASDPNKEIEYLSNPHEIAAFARAAVEELRNVNYTDEDIRSIIVSKGRMKDLAGDSDTLWLYWDMFGTDPNSIVWRRFLQAMAKVLEVRKAASEDDEEVYKQASVLMESLRERRA